METVTHKAIVGVGVRVHTVRHSVDRHPASHVTRARMVGRLVAVTPLYHVTYVGGLVVPCLAGREVSPAEHTPPLVICLPHQAVCALVAFGTLQPQHMLLVYLVHGAAVVSGGAKQGLQTHYDVEGE